MTDERLATIFALHMPSWIPAWYVTGESHQQGSEWLFLMALLAALAASFTAFCFSLQETSRYIERVKKGSDERVTRVAAAWLCGLPMYWVAMNFAAM